MVGAEEPGPPRARVRGPALLRNPTTSCVKRYAIEAQEVDVFGGRILLQSQTDVALLVFHEVRSEPPIPSGEHSPIIGVVFH